MKNMMIIGTMIALTAVIGANAQWNRVKSKHESKTKSIEVKRSGSKIVADGGSTHMVAAGDVNGDGFKGSRIRESPTFSGAAVTEFNSKEDKFFDVFTLKSSRIQGADGVIRDTDVRANGIAWGGPTMLRGTARADSIEVHDIEQNGVIRDTDFKARGANLVKR